MGLFCIWKEFRICDLLGFFSFAPKKQILQCNNRDTRFQFLETKNLSGGQNMPFFNKLKKQTNMEKNDLKC